MTRKNVIKLFSRNLGNFHRDNLLGPSRKRETYKTYFCKNRNWGEFIRMGTYHIYSGCRHGVSLQCLGTKLANCHHNFGMADFNKRVDSFVCARIYEKVDKKNRKQAMDANCISCYGFCRPRNHLPWIHSIVSLLKQKAPYGAFCFNNILVIVSNFFEFFVPSQFFQCFCLNLTYSLAGNSKLLSRFFQCVHYSIVQTKSHS